MRWDDEGSPGRAAGAGAVAEAQAAALAAAEEAGEAAGAAADELAGSRAPYLIGVRHHSPVLAAALPELLAAAAPEVLFVELPGEFGPWLPHLADPGTCPPVALAGHGPRGLVFLPFAEFSPELVALRWARDAGVPVVPFDLPLGAPPAPMSPPEDAPPEGGGASPGGSGGSAVDGSTAGDPSGGDFSAGDSWEGGAGDGSPAGAVGGSLAGALRRRAGEDLWDRLVETAAPGGTAESLRRAALLVGWALRHDARSTRRLDPHDLRREAHMRSLLARYGAGRRVAAVVGAFHAPALLPGAGSYAKPVNIPPGPERARPNTAAGPAADTGGAIVVPVDLRLAEEAPRGGPGKAAQVDARETVTTSLVPYTYGLLDERSGYPAGIRDPEWQHGVVAAGAAPDGLDELLLRTAVRVCAEVRAAGHPSGPPDAREIVRHARDLATLRGYPAAGRKELAEAVETVLTQGQLLGRGRVVAQALETVLVGGRRGRLAPGTPRSGLAPSVEGLLAELDLPDPARPERKELRLDPYRSPLDRRREIALRRLDVCGVPYGQPASAQGAGGTAGIGTRWALEWTPSTAAMLDVVAVYGPELGRAAEGLLRGRALAERREGGPTAAQILAGLHQAAQCALPELAADRLAEAAAVLPAVGTLPELLAGMTLLDRLGSGLVPGLPEGWEAKAVAAASAELTAAGVRALDGLAGSEDPADAMALADLAARGTPGLRMADALARLADTGTPLIRGAAGAARVLLAQAQPHAFGTVLAARTDGATTPELRADLAAFLTGALTAAGPLLEAGELLAPMVTRIESLPDRAFLDRLPALRQGFDALSPAARSRLLASVRAEDARTALTAPAPEVLARHTAADLAGREALAGRGLLAVLDAAPREPAGAPNPAGEGEARKGSDEPLAIAADVRWQLLLGRLDPAASPRALRIGAALDELYGSGRGEGSGEGGGVGGQRGGDGPSYPDVRSWSEELAALFGEGVREEVLASAAAAGRLDAALELDPAAARPSVELLRTVLSYAGGLPEGQLAKLRPLVARIVEELTRALADRLRPALTGLAHPRPSRRPGGPLDLARTVRANLATARRDPADGTLTVLPERPVFRTRARKAADWRIVLVVDVSGSMEASTVWSAVTASVLAGVPALSTHFVAFSTEVLDLTDHVEDPLGLLLEVRVGGGTRIAAGLRHARSLVTVPSRTLVVLITDFEEGGPVGPLLSEVRALADAGCHLLGCASLDDAGRPRYSAGIASQVVAAGMPVAALSPLELARWVGERVAGRAG